MSETGASRASAIVPNARRGLRKKLGHFGSGVWSTSSAVVVACARLFRSKPTDTTTTLALTQLCTLEQRRQDAATIRALRTLLEPTDIVAVDNNDHQAGVAPTTMVPHSNNSCDAMVSDPRFKPTGNDNRINVNDNDDKGNHEEDADNDSENHGDVGLVDWLRSDIQHWSQVPEIHCWLAVPSAGADVRQRCIQVMLQALLTVVSATDLQDLLHLTNAADVDSNECATSTVVFETPRLSHAREDADVDADVDANQDGLGDMLTFEIWQYVSLHDWREVHISFPLSMFSQPPPTSTQIHNNNNPAFTHLLSHDVRHVGQSMLWLQAELLSQRACRHHDNVESLQIVDVLLESLTSLHEMTPDDRPSSLTRGFYEQMSERCLYESGASTAPAPAASAATSAPTPTPAATSSVSANLRDYLQHRHVRVHQLHTNDSMHAAWANIPLFARPPSSQNVSLIEIITRGQIVQSATNRRDDERGKMTEVEDRRLFAVQNTSGVEGGEKEDACVLVNHVCSIWHHPRGSKGENTPIPTATAVSSSSSTTPLVFHLCLAPFLRHLFQRLSMATVFDSNTLDGNLTISCLSRICHCLEFGSVLTTEERTGVQTLLAILVQERAQSAMRATTDKVDQEETPFAASQTALARLHVLYAIERMQGNHHHNRSNEPSAASIFAPSAILSRLLSSLDCVAVP